MNERAPDCMDLMKRVHEMIEKKANSNLMRHDITFSQLQMLMTLDMEEQWGGDEVKLKDLERYFGVAQSTAAGIAARLERKGLVTGSTDARDKRVKRLRITEAGRTVCRETHAGMVETRRRFLSALTPEEAEEFTRLLRKVYRAIQS